MSLILKCSWLSLSQNCWILPRETKKKEKALIQNLICAGMSYILYSLWHVGNMIKKVKNQASAPHWNTSFASRWRKFSPDIIDRVGHLFHPKNTLFFIHAIPIYSLNTLPLAMQTRSTFSQFSILYIRRLTRFVLFRTAVRRILKLQIMQNSVGKCDWGDGNPHHTRRPCERVRLRSFEAELKSWSSSKRARVNCRHGSNTDKNIGTTAKVRGGIILHHNWSKTLMVI